MYTRTFAALAALALTAGTLAISTPVRAAPADDQVQVRIGDLDPSDSRDAATLDRRIRSAARQICGWESPLDLRLQRQVAECQSEVTESARSDARIALAAGRPQQRIALNRR
jgi:UrcA family protein